MNEKYIRKEYITQRLAAKIALLEHDFARSDDEDEKQRIDSAINQYRFFMQMIENMSVHEKVNESSDSLWLQENSKRIDALERRMNDFESSSYCPDFDKKMNRLEDIITIQTSSGNYNCNPYMWGMANGLILAKSIMLNIEPQYIEKPDTWLDES